MKVVHIHEEYPEHDWVRNEDGSIDEFATENGFHNGPLCRRCYYSFCEHCVNDFDEALKEDLPCVIDECKCPNCGKYAFQLSTTKNGDEFGFSVWYMYGTMYFDKNTENAFNKYIEEIDNVPKEFWENN